MLEYFLIAWGLDQRLAGSTCQKHSFQCFESDFGARLCFNLQLQYALPPPRQQISLAHGDVERHGATVFRAMASNLMASTGAFQALL